MFALVHSKESELEGYFRVVQVEETPFEVHSNLFWVACSSETQADTHMYRVADETIVEKAVVYDYPPTNENADQIPIEVM